MSSISVAKAASDKDYVFTSSWCDDSLVKGQYIEDMSYSFKKLARLLKGLVNVYAVSAAIAGDAATDTTAGTAVQPVAVSPEVQFLRHAIGADDFSNSFEIRSKATKRRLSPFVRSP